MAQQDSIRRRTTQPGPEIPDKLYFRIGDVARICEVPAYVLRFWESEFPQLRPNKSGTGQRLYRRRDVELALRVKRLLYDEGYTIPGARQVFKTEGRHKELAPVPAPAAVPSESGEATPGAVTAMPAGPSLDETRRLERLRREMREVLAMLSKPVPAPKPRAIPPVQPIRPLRPLAVAPRNEAPKKPLRMPEPNKGLLLFDLGGRNEALTKELEDDLFS